MAGAVLFGVAAIAQAHAVRRHDLRPGTTPDLRDFVRLALRDPVLLAVVAAYLVGFTLHAVAIWWLPLYLAQATVALSLPVTAVAAHRLDGRMALTAWGGVAAVTAGLVLLAYASGQPGEVRTSWWLPALLATGLVVLAWVGHAGHALGGAALGWLAGFGYAGSALAVRGVGWPLQPPMVVAAALVPLLGLVAFWLYSRGLARQVVAAATAPMITVQTFVPAVVGVALLGDGVRPGWEAAVGLGLVLAVAGAAVVPAQPS